MLSWFSAIDAQLIARLQSHKLHHALLLSGPSGLGKHAYLPELAQAILCQSKHSRCGTCQSCQLFAAGSHPDFYMIQSDKQIGVDDVRQGLEKLQGHAQLQQNKCLIIHAADTMTESAANALLKTLEEPTNNTFIILSASSARLLPTILSRCEKLTLPLASVSEIQSWLATEHNLSANEALVSAYVTPFKVLAALEDSSGLTFAEFSDDIQAIQTGNLLPLHFGQKWQSKAIECIGWLQHYYLQQTKLKMGTADYTYFAQKLKLSTLTASKMHHAGINKALLLSELLSQ